MDLQSEHRQHTSASARASRDEPRRPRRRSRQHHDGHHDSAFDRSRRDQFGAVAGVFLQRRPHVVGAGLLMLWPMIWLSPAPRLQAIALTVGTATMCAMFIVEGLLARRHPVSERQLALSLSVTTLGIALACMLTGALASPLLSLLFAPVVTAFVAFGRARRSAMALAGLAAVVTLIAVDPLGFPELAEPWRAMIAAMTCLLSASLLYLSVCGLTDAYWRTGRELLAARNASLDEAEARLRDLAAVSAEMAHELRNPLSAVKGLLQLSARGAEGRDAERLHVALEQLELLETRLDASLGLHRAFHVGEREMLELDAELERLAALLGPRASRQGQVLELELERDLRALADRRRFREAIINLVLNAIQAGGDRVTLTLTRHHDRALIAVRDRGCGMDEATMAKLGQAFVSTRTEGTGLGVVVAQSVAHAHGGTLSYDSNPGQGTTATLSWPLPPQETA